MGFDLYPVPEAYIRIYSTQHNQLLYEDFFISDNTGLSIRIPLACVDDMDTKVAYSTYHIEVSKQGFQTQKIKDIQIFPQIHSTLYVLMVPIINNQKQILESFIDAHHVSTDKMEPRILPTSHPLGKGGTSDMLREVIIPTNITVHLGRPSANAENLTVPFLYYLKNVASSEVYPTWPYEALKANIWAQISLVLNRVFTEWYPSQGYNFDITNSTAFDQAFVKNRNIYDNISSIVDDVFNEYVQKRNFQEPFYAEYCDGKIAQCPGMKQWGTLDLARRGFDAFSILRYYYGDEINIRSSNNIQEIQSSYPGTALRFGSEGPVVSQIQAQLNGIAINYPNIKPIFPVNAIFNASTEAAVRTFQRQFNLTVDGIVGKATYYKISFVYVAVRKLAELGSLGHLRNLYTGEWQGRVLRFGDRGVETQLMQYYLHSISLFYPEIPTISIDGRFGNGTQNAVIAFQKRFGLVGDGLVGQATWERIYEVYTSIENEIPSDTTSPVYPGTPLALGDRGDNIRTLQRGINQYASRFTSVPSVNEDGIFGMATRNAVREIQRLNNLDMDGIVGERTWNVIFSNTTSASMNTQDSQEVAQLQHELSHIASFYPALTHVAINNNFDDATRHAVCKFQTMMGLPSTGEPDATTQHVVHQMYKELQTNETE